MANLRCSSGGHDFGDNDVAQLAFDVVVIALKLVLVEHEYVKYEKPNQAELPPFTIVVLEQLHQAKHSSVAGQDPEALSSLFSFLMSPQEEKGQHLCVLSQHGFCSTHARVP